MRLDKWQIYDHPRVNWQPHKGQLIVAENNARHKVVSAGRRWGKSYMGGVDKLLPEVFITKPIASTLLSEGKKRIFWIVGPNFSDSEKEFRVIWNYLKKLEIPMYKPSYNSPETGDMIITLWDGAMQIVAKSAQNPERLVGEGLSGVILSEAAKLKESIWYKYIRPTLADFQGWSFSSSTPEGKNWFYRLWQDGQDPNNPDWASWRMPAWINNYVYRVPTKESDVMKLLEAKRHSGTSVYKLANDMNITIDPEILASINELTPEAFLQEIAADFTEFVGRVFKEFDEEKHVTDLTFNPGWQTFAAVDYGYCVDTETEILTKDGWKKYDEIGYGTECLTLNTETHLAEWGNVQDVKVFDGEWDMVRMKSKSHDSFTTSNHRWFTKWLGNQKNWDWRWKTSSTFSDNDYVPTALPVTNLPETPKYTDALVELVAWYWTEGSRFSRGGVNRGGEISQNDNHNADRIYAALYETFGPPSESMREGRKNNRGPKWKDWKQRSNADCWDARGYFQLNGPALAPILEIVQGQDKIVSASFVAALTKSQLKLFVETSLAADGANVGASLMISQSKWQRLEPLQMACQLLGYQTVLRKTPQYGPEYGSLTIFQRYNQFHPKNLVQEEKWSGRVWCPTTNNGTWFARRNGTVYATGNCNPNVWLLIQMGPWGEINVLDEIYEEGLDPEDFADEIRWRKLNPGNLRYFFPDPADPGASRILEKKLNIKARGGTGGELNSRINHIRKALREPRYTTDELYIKPDFEVGTLRPKLMFDRRCKRTIEDMLNYRYPEKQAERETSTKRFDSPMKKDDHGPEALGRFFAGMFGQFGKPMTGTTIHSATFRRDESASAPRDFRGFKDERFTRPAAHEKRREDFPTINDGFDNYMKGHI